MYNRPSACQKTCETEDFIAGLVQFHGFFFRGDTANNDNINKQS